MRVALYARVSTAHTHQDPEVQLSALRAWCDAHDHVIVRSYVDHGVSGKKTRRPALDQLMAAARDRAFDAIVVWKLDRFARSVKHLVTAINELESYGVKFISAQDQIDMSSPAGRFMFHVLAAVAEFELALISERIKNGLRHTKEVNGRVPGPKVVGKPSRSTIWRRSKQ